MSMGKSNNTARNASWRNLDSTLQELSNQPLQEAAQSMSVGNWAADLLTGGQVPSQSTGHGQDAWSGYWYSDPTSGYSLPTGPLSYGAGHKQSMYYIDPATGAQQFNPSGAWALQAGPVLGTAYENDISSINRANELEATYNARAGTDYAQVEQDRQLTMALQGLLGGDVSTMQQQLGNIDWARQQTINLETGTGLFGTQQAYIDQAVQSGQAAVQQQLASMGLGESTQKAMLQNQVAQAGAATAGRR